MNDHDEDDWDLGLADALAGEGRGWVLAATTLIVLLLIAYHLWFE